MAVKANHHRTLSPAGQSYKSKNVANLHQVHKSVHLLKAGKSFMLKILPENAAFLGVPKV
ncbi:MAG: hypothetical protein LBU14_00430 [Candidatus Peribacteria bacterium]|nr:hypothetical protein [Candidatus Peribacteria bacterium]